MFFFILVALGFFSYCVKFAITSMPFEEINQSELRAHINVTYNVNFKPIWKYVYHKTTGPLFLYMTK